MPILGSNVRKLGGLGTSAAFTYQHRLEFSGAVDAPLPSSIVEGNATVTYIQTDGSFSVANGVLQVPTQTTPAWGDLGFYVEPAITRKRGFATVLTFNLTDATGDAYLMALLSAKNINTVGGANVNAGVVYATGRYNPVGNGSAADFTNGAAGAPLINWFCQLAIILRDTGAFLLMKGGAVPDWELLFPVDVGTAATLYPALSNQTIAGGVYHLRTADLVANKYTEWDDNYALATSRTASPSNNVTTTMEANAIVEFTWTPASAQTLTIEFRKTDDSNLLKLVCDQAAGTIKLYNRVAGTDTELDSGKTQTWTVGVARRIVIRCYGTGIDTIVANIRKHAATGQTSNQSGTGVKVSGFTTGANLICWQRQLSTTLKAGLNAISSDAAIPDNPNAFSATNAANPLTITTYDGSGQATHPSVLDFGSDWNGYRYWMAMTPYPAGDDTKENPSILASADGDTWVIPPGLTNPITGTPTGAWYYSDPDLIYANGYLYCIYRSSEGGTDNFYFRKSADGVTWSDQASLFSVGLATALSPAIVYDGTQYVMYTIDSQVAPGTQRTLQRRTAPSPEGTWSSVTNCTYIGAAAGVGSGIWHIDVIKTATGYHAVASTAPGAGGVLWFLTSVDGLTWWVSLSNLLGLGAGAAWDSGMLYRSSMTAVGTGYSLWYAATNGDDGATWGIGRTTIAKLQ